MEPQLYDSNDEIASEIRKCVADGPLAEDAANTWKNLASGFVVAAMPDYLKCIVLDQHFVKFLQREDNTEVANSLRTQLLLENTAHFGEGAAQRNP